MSPRHDRLNRTRTMSSVVAVFTAVIGFNHGGHGHERSWNESTARSFKPVHEPCSQFVAVFAEGIGLTTGATDTNGHGMNPRHDLLRGQEPCPQFVPVSTVVIGLTY